MTRFDFRPFLAWVAEDLLPLPADADLYAVADRVCLEYTLGADPDPDRWLPRLAPFRADDGRYVERVPTHHDWHSTAYALAAMQLCAPLDAATVEAFDRFRDPATAIAFLDGLDWATRVYPGSHEGAALCAIAALVPGFADDAWFQRVFAALDARVMPANGMMGEGKPRGGDLDQVGGTFHYLFVYEHLGRVLPHAEARIDAVLGLQQPGGLWHRLNPVWLTLDAVYLMTRSGADERIADAIDRALEVYAAELTARDQYTGPLAAHTCVAVCSLLAEAQRARGDEVVVSDHPLRLVLDRRPFI